jgi:polysaccharide export outer membrane protein
MRTSILSAARLVLCLLAAGSILPAQEQPDAVQAKQPPSAKAEPVRGEGVAGAPGLAAPVDPKTYVLGPEDVIYIRVWREPDLSEAAAVRPDGQITMPLVGEVQAGGLTPVQLAARLTEKLSQFINRPEVMVSVQAVRSKRYYVTGEVNRSGAFPMAVPTTVLEALTLCGGFREFANQKNITILRGTKKFKFNYREVIQGKNMSQNILLENGDYIIVR